MKFCKTIIALVVIWRATVSLAEDTPDVRREIDTFWRATQGEMIYYRAARAAISPDQIMGVGRFYWNNGNPSLSALKLGPDYVYRDPEVSAYPMPIHNATIEAAFVAPQPHGVGFIPGAIVPDGYNAQPGRLSATPSTSCLPLKRVPLRTPYSRTIATMIAAGILTGTSSGQLWSVPGHDELLVVIA